MIYLEITMRNKYLLEEPLRKDLKKANSPKWYRSYSPYPSKELVSPVCGISFISNKKGIWHIYFILIFPCNQEKKNFFIVILQNGATTQSFSQKLILNFVIIFFTLVFMNTTFFSSHKSVSSTLTISGSLICFFIIQH